MQHKTNKGFFLCSLQAELLTCEVYFFSFGLPLTFKVSINCHQIKCFLLQVTLAMVFNQSNRKIAKHIHLEFMVLSLSLSLWLNLSQSSHLLTERQLTSPNLIVIVGKTGPFCLQLLLTDYYILDNCFHKENQPVIVGRHLFGVTAAMVLAAGGSCIPG